VSPQLFENKVRSFDSAQDDKKGDLFIMPIRAIRGLFDFRVKQRIENLPIFEDVVSEASFENEAGFFQHARGCGIVRKHFRRDSAERKILEAEVRDRGYCFSHDAVSPELLPEPVTHCRCMSMHVLARMNTDPADGRALNLDAKFHFRLFGYRSLQEFVPVLHRVRMREAVAYR
jgi:hypothetical protein